MSEIDEIIAYYKPLGYTPLEAIGKLRTERPELSEAPITYAGRLDPMAEGLLLLLAGKAVHRKDELNNLDKTYEAKILLGFKSDTGDILGIAEHDNSVENFSEHDIQNSLQNMTGTLTLPLPVYSSPPIKGKPLWQWARENRLNEIEIPKREMSVNNIKFLNLETVLWKDIYQNILNSISLVRSSDFRQNEVLESWEQINLKLPGETKLQIVSVAIDCSSGTYIRSLAEELGRKSGCSTLLYHLKRTRAGNYTIPF